MAALNKVHGRDARGNDWIQESYETGDPVLRARASDLRRRGYHVRSVSLGSQVTQYGRVKMTMLDIRAGRSGDDYLEQVNPRRRRTGRRNAGRGSFRKTKKQLRKKGYTIKSSKRMKHAIKGSFEGTGRSAPSMVAWGTGPKWRRANLPRVKGRKVKGGRAVTLHNFTGTIVKRSDGTVQFLGRGRKR